MSYTPQYVMHIRSGLGEAKSGLIMLRSVVRFHLAPPEDPIAIRAGGKGRGSELEVHLSAGR
jgi:hypothetical protein